LNAIFSLLFLLLRQAALTLTKPKYPVGVYHNTFFFVNDGPSEKYNLGYGFAATHWTSVSSQPFGEGACAVSLVDSMIVLGGSIAGNRVQVLVGFKYQRLGFLFSFYKAVP
jgi:hypothetical protein